MLRENKLTERHARALLRIEKEEDRLDVLKHVVENDLNVAKTEEYIDNLLKGKPVPPPPKAKAKKSPFFALKDVRIFVNTVTRGLGLMKNQDIECFLSAKRNRQRPDTYHYYPEIKDLAF